MTGPPNIRAAAGRGPLLENCIGFSRALRSAGVATSPAEAIEFSRALGCIDIGNPADFRAAARATLVHRRDDLPAFERIFIEYWYGQRAPVAKPGAEGETELSGSWPRHPSETAEPAAAEGEDESQALYSDEERLAARDLATLNDREIERARRLIRQFAAALPTVRTHRFRTARRGSVPDFRRLLRSLAVRGNDLSRLPFRQRPVRRARLLLLCDVSGSMRGYARFLLELIYGMRRELPDTEIAVFATRLTVISDLLDSREIRRSLDDVTARAADWGGGTDIGGCLRDFNDRYARTHVASQTVVVLLSDGWDRGDPRVMREEIARLRRYAHRFIWLNPLLRFDEYEPLTRGMRTALPQLDHFLPCHSVESLTRFALTLSREWA